MPRREVLKLQYANLWLEGDQSQRESRTLGPAGFSRVHLQWRYEVEGRQGRSALSLGNQDQSAPSSTAWNGKKGERSSGEGGNGPLGEKPTTVTTGSGAGRLPNVASSKPL